MNITIRDEQAQDIQVIEVITIEAFKDVEYSSHTEHFIVHALRQANQLSISLVAILEERVVGHVAVSPVLLNGEFIDWYGLGPISVLPKLQAQGIGAQLMNAVIEKLKIMNAKGCVLLGDPNYYARFGFKAIKGLTLADVPPEYFQALSFDGQYPQAEVTYHKAFEAKS